MADSTNKVIAIDIKTHIKMAMPICEIEGFAKGCEIAFPEAAKAFKEIGCKAHALLEAWYALEESEKKETKDCDKCRLSCTALEFQKIIKERDELKAKLATSQNYEAVIAAKDREIAAVKEERNRLNAKVNELMKKTENMFSKCLGKECATYKRLAAAERCIEEIWNLYNPTERAMKDASSVVKIIRAYREKE